MTTAQTDLTRLFDPRAVAVVGATDRPNDPTRMHWERVRSWGHQKGIPVWPISRSRQIVGGDAAYPRLSSLESAPDVAVVMVTDPVPVIEEAAEIGTPFVIIFAAGYAEAGSEAGAVRELALREAVQRTGVRVLGPNTTPAIFSTFPKIDGRKRVALVTQSGSQGWPMLELQRLGVPVAHWVATGNEVDLEVSDFLTHFATLDDIGAIAVYLEGVRDGSRYVEALEACLARGVPVVTVKAGITDRGKEAVQSHTAHLAGEDRIFQAIFDQYGVIRTNEIDELVDVCQLLCLGRPPLPDRGVAFYTMSGGIGAHVVDATVSAGLKMAEFSSETVEALGEWIPAFLQKTNPVDAGIIGANAELAAPVLRTMAADPQVDTIFGVIAGGLAPELYPLCHEFARTLMTARDENPDQTVCALWVSPVSPDPPLEDELLASEVPVFRRIGNLITALEARKNYFAFRRELTDDMDWRTTGDQSSSAVPQRGDTPTTTLNEVDSKSFVASYGIPISEDIICHTRTDATDAGRMLGLPVVVKALTPEVAHKDKLGLVQVGIDSEDELAAAYERIVSRCAELGLEPDGMIVSRMVMDAHELIVGLVDVPVFEKMVMVGAGGTDVEAHGEVGFLRVPFAERDAQRLLSRLKLKPALRSLLVADQQLAGTTLDTIMAFQRMALAFPDHSNISVEVNPLLVSAKGVVAVDALVTVAPS